MRFIATAEHSGGQSTARTCSRGAIDDPANTFQREVSAATFAECENAAQNLLVEAVDRESERPECRCNHCLASAGGLGSNAWWNSVSISLWPQDREAAEAMRAADLYPERDPYGLIPEEARLATDNDD